MGADVSESIETTLSRSAFVAVNQRLSVRQKCVRRQNAPLNMKQLWISLALLAGSLWAVTADQLTYEVTGKVSYERTGGRFAVGRPYVLTFEVESTTAKSVVIPERGDFRNAISSYLFDYDSGVYTAAARIQGGISVWNDERGLYDHFQISGFDGFPPLDGRAFSTFMFTLTDTSAVVFANTDLPQSLDAGAFQLRQFQLGWSFDFDFRTILLTVDSIRVVSRRPGILAADRRVNGLDLIIELPDGLSTNVLERALQWGNLIQWEPVATFVANGGTTNWVVPIVPSRPAEFFRMRPRDR